jgi:soluble lytic murein transglycosylase-like protein
MRVKTKRQFALLACAISLWAVTMHWGVVAHATDQPTFWLDDAYLPEPPLPPISENSQPVPQNEMAPQNNITQKAQQEAQQPTEPSPAQGQVFVAATDNNSHAISPQAMAALQGLMQQRNRQLPATQRQIMAQALVNTAQRYHINYKVLAAIIAVESSFRVGVVAPGGFLGLGQLSPQTARWLGVNNPLDMQQNLDGTALLIQRLLNKAHGNVNRAIVGYKCGLGTVNNLAVKAPAYVAQVTQYMQQL